MIFLELFWTFFKIGLFTFGGGYAMIAVVEDACVGEKKWITHQEMMELIVIAESTPGPIAINCATYVGYRQRGFWGSVAATLGMVFPSFAIIYAISMFLEGFLEITLIANAFKGIKIAVGFLIVQAGLKMAKNLKKKPLPMVLLWGCFALMLAVNIFSWKLSSILMMVVCACIGLGVYARRKAGGRA